MLGERDVPRLSCWSLSTGVHTGHGGPGISLFTDSQAKSGTLTKVLSKFRFILDLFFSSHYIPVSAQIRKKVCYGKVMEFHPRAAVGISSLFLCVCVLLRCSLVSFCQDADLSVEKSMAPPLFPPPSLFSHPCIPPHAPGSNPSSSC